MMTEGQEKNCTTWEAWKINNNPAGTNLQEYVESSKNSGLNFMTS